MESYVRIGGKVFEKSYIPLHWGRGVKNCQNHPYVINEWPLKVDNAVFECFQIAAELSSLCY